jgi:hypothetical protein
MASLNNRDHLELPPDEDEHGLLSHAATHFLVLGLLCLLPCIVLIISIDSGESLLRTHLLRVPVVFWAAWGVLSIWAALDMPRISKLFGRSTDPLGPQAMALCILALINCISVLAFLFMRRSV